MNIDSISGTSADQSFSSKTVSSVYSTEQGSSSSAMVNEEQDKGTLNKDSSDMLVANAIKNSNSDNQEDVSSLKDMKDINKIINHNTIAEFGYNEPTNRITIKIKDKETNEVIKEIPSEKALKMLAKAWELAGIMVDEKR